MVEIHSRFKPADIDRVVAFHQKFVGHPYRLNDEFASQVRSGLSAYLDNFDAAKDCIWLAELNAQLVGTVGIVRETDEVARVRWLLVHPEHRDGLEEELLERALLFCRGKYEKIYLLAATLFERLAPLAKAVGFQKVEERTVVLWGLTVRDERYELELLKDMI